MTNDEMIEILAMNIWKGVFGLTAITAEWQEWAKTHSTEANALRGRAEEMIGAALAHAGQGATKTRTAHHTSLGWLFA
jgi:hypothetical protein